MEEAGLTPLQQEKYQQQLKRLPTGTQFFNWIAQQVGQQVGEQVGWEPADKNAPTARRTNRINLLNSNGDVLCTLEPSREEVAKSFAIGENWIEQVVQMIQGEDLEHGSSMHDKFEQDMKSQYEDMMSKLTGDNDDE